MIIKFTDFKANELELLISEGIQVSVMQNGANKIVLRLELVNSTRKEKFFQSVEVQENVVISESESVEERKKAVEQNNVTVEEKTQEEGREEGILKEGLPEIFQNPQKEEELRDLRANGEKVEEIAQYFGVSVSTIFRAYRVLGLVGIKKKGVLKTFRDTPEKLEEFFKLYDEGWTYRELEEYFQISEGVIKLLLKKYQHLRRGRGVCKRKKSSSEIESTSEMFLPKKEEALKETTATISTESSAEEFEESCFTNENEREEVSEIESKKTVNSNRKERINNMRAFHNSFSPEEKGRILQQYKEGESLTNLATHLWITKNVLKKFLQECGVEIRDGRKEIVCKAPHLTENEKRALFDAIAKGMNNAEIKSVISVTDSQLRYYRKQFRGY